MAEASNKSRQTGSRRRGGRARAQMAGGMLASLSAAASSNKPKSKTSASHHVNQDDTPNKVDNAGNTLKRIPLKEETINRLDSTTSSPKPREELSNKSNIASDDVHTTLEIVATSQKNNIALKSPTSDLSSVCDDTLTPPLTSVKMKNNRESALLSPISFAGLSLSPKIPNNSQKYDRDRGDKIRTYEESVDRSHVSKGGEDSVMSNSSIYSEENVSSSSSSSCSKISSITNQEIAANPRIVINRKVAKDFYGKTYVGTIVGYDDSDRPPFWQVQYTDGDAEDFTYAELMSGIDYFDELEKDGNIPSLNDSDDNASDDDQSVYDDIDDIEECFEEEESDDEDYSIEHESDSEDELEIDEGVDSEVKKGKKATKRTVLSKYKNKSDTPSKSTHSHLDSSQTETPLLDECKADLSAQIDDVADDDVDVSFDIMENSIDQDADISEGTTDSDPIAVVVHSEDEVNSESSCFQDHEIVDGRDAPALQVTGLDSTRIETPTVDCNVEESKCAQIVDEVNDSGYPTDQATGQENKYDLTSKQVDIIQPEELDNADSIPVANNLKQEPNSKAQTPTTSELFAVVDDIFISSDKDAVTVKDVKNSVAKHFGLEKMHKEMKQAIKNRLIDLIQKNIQPDEKEDDQSAVGEDAESGSSCNGSPPKIIHPEESSYVDCIASYSFEESQSNASSKNALDAPGSCDKNVVEQIALPEPIFQNLSPEYSIHSKAHDSSSNDHELIQSKDVSFSPVIGKKTSRNSSRSAVVKGKWSLGPEIGIGSFGRVHTGLNNLSGSIMAVKVLNIPNDNEQSVLDEFQREIDVMKTLNHPNIVRYLGAEFDGSQHTLNIFQEWVPGGSVSSLLKRFGPFTIDIVKTYLQQILRGLDYLHSHGIIHRDIKGGNILVGNDGSVKLADFGASKKIETFGSESGDRMEMTMRGTPYFMAPECFDEKYGLKADIWSVGGVIYQMVTGSPPWKRLGFKNPLALIRHITNHKGAPELPTLNQFNRGDRVLLDAILQKCFEKEPSNRPLASELLLDSFFEANTNRDAPPLSPKIPLSSPTSLMTSPLQKMVENQESGASPSTLCFSLQQIPEDETSNDISSDSLCYSLTMTSPLKINETHGAIDSSEWPLWAKNRHIENISAGKENMAAAPNSSTKKIKQNPFARKKPLATRHTNSTHSSNADMKHIR